MQVCMHVCMFVCVSVYSICEHVYRICVYMFGHICSINKHETHILDMYETCQTNSINLYSLDKQHVMHTNINVIYMCLTRDYRTVSVYPCPLGLFFTIHKNIFPKARNFQQQISTFENIMSWCQNQAQHPRFTLKTLPTPQPMKSHTSRFWFRFPTKNVILLVVTVVLGWRVDPTYVFKQNLVMDEHLGEKRSDRLAKTTIGVYLTLSQVAEIVGETWQGNCLFKVPNREHVGNLS